VLADTGGALRDNLDPFKTDAVGIKMANATRIRSRPLFLQPRDRPHIDLAEALEYGIVGINGRVGIIAFTLFVRKSKMLLKNSIGAVFEARERLFNQAPSRKALKLRECCFRGKDSD
jgi:hypothetical protein